MTKSRVSRSTLFLGLFAFALILLGAVVACNSGQPTTEPDADQAVAAISPTSDRVKSVSTATHSPTSSAIAVPTPTPDVTATPTHTLTATPAPTDTPAPAAASTPTASPAPAVTLAPRPTATPTQSPSTPAHLGLDPFYERYLDAGGLPVVASSKVPDAALVRARELIDEMLANRPDIRATLAESGRKVTVVADSEVITDIPEFRDIYESDPGTDWNKRVQGGGLSGNRRDPTTAVWEGNLLCYGGDVSPNEDIFVHEFAHEVLNHGVGRQPGGREFRTRLQTSYQEAIDAGLWDETYAG